MRPSLGDYDNDGNLDIFCANYGPNGLYRNVDGKQFINVAPELGLAIDNCYDSGAWGDWDNDGRIDLYVNGTVTRGRSFEDYLFHNDGTRFSDVTSEFIRKNDADHGVQWLDFDRDGDLDLALTNGAAAGMHFLLRNELPADAGQALPPGCRRRCARTLHPGGRGGPCLRQCHEHTPRNEHHGHRFRLRFTERDAGAFRPGAGRPVDVEVTTMTPKGRRSVRLTKISPKDYSGRYLTVKVDANGTIVK